MRHSPGWYLGLRYMQGTGLVARVGEKLDARRRGVNFIFADRVLCQAIDWREVLHDWWNALAPQGCLVLWLPDCRHIALDDGEARLTLDDVGHALDACRGWQLHESDVIDGHIYTVWQKRDDARQIRTPWRKQSKHLLITRTGAHGDALMASSILPWLKEQGWTISFITKYAGYEILKSDPHVDELILLHEGQVKEEEFPYYWQAWQKRFDRFINLTYSVEGELLKQPGRGDYWWPDEQRRVACRRSYLDHVHRLADVPKPYRVRFYPNADETDWAKQRARQYGKHVLWCLRGSAVHKWWPHGPQAICQLLAKTDLSIALSGSADSEPLAREIMNAIRNYHGDARRVYNLVGTNSIREIITLAHYARVVVGPETGVLNAVSLQPVPKVLLLSHSSAKNLSDDWVMTTAIKPSTACYPCHRLHYDHEWCPQDKETGAAACAASINPEHVVSAVIAALHSEDSQRQDKNFTTAA